MEGRKIVVCCLQLHRGDSGSFNYYPAYVPAALAHDDYPPLFSHLSISPSAAAAHQWSSRLFIPQNLSDLAWAFSDRGHADERLFKMLAKRLDKILIYTSGQAQNQGPNCLSSISSLYFPIFLTVLAVPRQIYACLERPHWWTWPLHSLLQSNMTTVIPMASSITHASRLTWCKKSSPPALNPV